MRKKLIAMILASSLVLQNGITALANSDVFVDDVPIATSVDGESFYNEIAIEELEEDSVSSNEIVVDEVSIVETQEIEENGIFIDSIAESGTGELFSAGETIEDFLLESENPPESSETTENVVISMSVDKTSISEGEMATITIVMSEDYKAESIRLYKPITKNIVTLSFEEKENGIYIAKFLVNEQTESGLWKVKDFTYIDNLASPLYLYNSDTCMETMYETISFSEVDFQVTGTDADVNPPILESYNLNQNEVSNGETITFSAKVIDEHLPDQINLCYQTPSNQIYDDLYLNKVDDLGLYEGMLLVNDDTEIGLWKPCYFFVQDTNENNITIYNSNVTSMNEAIDLSALNFEVLAPHIHSYSDEWNIDIEPTCIVEGSKSYHCTTCDSQTEITIIPKVEHTYGKWIIDKNASCTKVGSKHKMCSICENILTEEIETTEHKYKTIKTVKATTEKNGKLTKQCVVCKKTKTETIYYPKTVSLSKTKFTYNGKIQKPTILVENSKGKTISASNYDITYSKGRRNVGTYKVIVTFKGNYSGTVTKTFSIVKSSQSITASNFTKKIGDSTFALNAKQTKGNGKLTYNSSNTSVATVSNTGIVTVKGVGETTISITAAATKNYTTITKKITVTVNPKGTSFYSAISKTAGKIDLNWNKVSDITGYQIQYAKKADFSDKKIVTLKNATTVNTTLSKLSKGTTYYIQIRTYKKVNKTNYYSDWSSKKAVEVETTYNIIDEGSFNEIFYEEVNFTLDEYSVVYFDFKLSRSVAKNKTEGVDIQLYRYDEEEWDSFPIDETVYIYIPAGYTECYWGYYPNMVLEPGEYSLDMNSFVESELDYKITTYPSFAESFQIPSTLSLKTEETKYLNITNLKPKGSLHGAVFESSNEKIATVSYNNQNYVAVTALKKGTCTITATLQNGTIYKCKVTITDPAPKLKYSTVEMWKSDTIKNKLLYTTKKVTWSSSNTQIATVSSTGVIKAQGVGECIIYAKCGGKTYKTTVKVVYQDPNFVAEVTSYNTRNNYFTVKFKNKSNKSVTIISNGAYCMNVDYTFYDRDLYLSNYNNITIPAETSKTIRFYIKGDLTWPDYKDFTVRYYFNFDGKQYLGSCWYCDSSYKTENGWYTTYWV